MRPITMPRTSSSWRYVDHYFISEYFIFASQNVVYERASATTVGGAVRRKGTHTKRIL